MINFLPKRWSSIFRTSGQTSTMDGVFLAFGRYVNFSIVSLKCSWPYLHEYHDVSSGMLHMEPKKSGIFHQKVTIQFRNWLSLLMTFLPYFQKILFLSTGSPNVHALLPKWFLKIQSFFQRKSVTNPSTTVAAASRLPKKDDEYHHHVRFTGREHDRSFQKIIMAPSTVVYF